VPGDFGPQRPQPFGKGGVRVGGGVIACEQREGLTRTLFAQPCLRGGARGGRGSGTVVRAPWEQRGDSDGGQQASPRRPGPGPRRRGDRHGSLSVRGGWAGGEVLDRPEASVPAAATCDAGRLSGARPRAPHDGTTRPLTLRHGMAARGQRHRPRPDTL
jgi:hypothetical protein